MECIINVESKDYVSIYETNKETPTVFHIGSIDGVIKGYIRKKTMQIDLSSKKTSDSVRTDIDLTAYNYLTVQFGLRGFDNFIHSRTKEPIKFDTISKSVGNKNYNVVSDVILALFPIELIDELATVIDDLNKLSGDDTKN